MNILSLILILLYVVVGVEFLALCMVAIYQRDTVEFRALRRSHETGVPAFRIAQLAVIATWPVAIGLVLFDRLRPT